MFKKKLEKNQILTAKERECFASFISLLMTIEQKIYSQKSKSKQQKSTCQSGESIDEVDMQFTIITAMQKAHVFTCFA